MERERSGDDSQYEGKLFEGKLYDIGFACGKMAEDIARLSPLDKILVVVPLRGGLPISKGVIYGLDRIARASKEFETSPIPEMDVVYAPASSIVKDRNEALESLVSDKIKKLQEMRGYKAVVILDEAVSGSSSKMVFNSVKNGVKDYKGDKDWKRFYWREMPVNLFVVASHNGYKLDPSFQKLSNVLIYPVEGDIITSDNNEIYPMQYVNVLERKVSSRSGKRYRVVTPDVLFSKNDKWSGVVEGIERGVDGYFEQKT